MGETADAQGCSHEPEVLNDGALLDCRKLINRCLQRRDGGNPTRGNIVLQVSAL